MTKPATNDYFHLVERICKITNPIGTLSTSGSVNVGSREYPLLKIVLGQGNRKRALISAGIHGDEPAGVEALCVFLEEGGYAPYLDDWEITLLPCLNPTGFEHGTRVNFQGKDLNRLFKEDHPLPEVTMVQETLDWPYDLDLELHEDVDSPGFYLYQKESTFPPSPLGRRILDAVEPIMPLNPASEIEGSPAERGLLARLVDPDDMEWWPMALYAHVRGCRHVFTLETSTHFEMNLRLRAHLTALRTALEQMSESLK